MTDLPPTEPLLTEPPPRRPRRLWPGLRSLLRTRIIAGLLAVIPIWVTWVVVSFVFDTMKSATEPIAWAVARRVEEGTQPVAPRPDERREREMITQLVTHWLQQSPPGLVGSAEQEEIIDRTARKLTYLLQEVPDATVGTATDAYLVWIVPVLAVLLTLFLLYFLGLLTASVFGRRLILLVDRLFDKVPLVKQVYRSTKQVAQTLGGSDTTSFKQVVLVEFPRPGMKRIAFVTSVMRDADTGRRLASVFVPYTPYLTTGYMQIMPVEDISETDWTVEQAVKWVMSGGILSPPTVPFDRTHRLERSHEAPREPAAPGASVQVQARAP